MDPKVIFQLMINVISMRYMLYVQKMKLTSAILTRPPCCEGGQVLSGRCRNRSAVLGGSSRGPRTLTQMSANQSQWSNITCIKLIPKEIMKIHCTSFYPLGKSMQQKNRQCVQHNCGTEQNIVQVYQLPWVLCS